METRLGDGIVLAWAGTGLAVFGFLYAVYSRRRNVDENKKNKQEIIKGALDGVNAQKVAESPGQYQGIEKTTQDALSETKLIKAVAKVVSVQILAESTETHKRAKEAWRTAARIAEEEKNYEVAAQAWLSVG